MRLLFALILSLASGSMSAAPVLSLTEVAPGVYVHFGVHELPDTKNHGAIANIGFVVGERCVAVIDTGGNPQQGKSLKLAIEHTTSKPVCYVINTHVHPDHIYGNTAFKAPGVQFVGHQKLARAMAARGLYYIDKAADQLDVKLTADDIIPPDIAVKDHLDLDLGGRTLKLTAHRAAHTDNDLTVYDQRTDTLWISDLLFIEHLPVIDGSLKGWLAELKTLESHAYKTVIPGHGPIVTDWPKSMQPEKAYLEMLLTEIRDMIRQGKYMEEAVETVGYSARGQWRLFDEFHRKNVTTAFAELEWEN
ncbi:MAG: quinoprotein relay system zinc metallohydrolase 2 [Methylobacter sp.]|uniref:quinoprotein relay system zinc metallohydrolase 2 n=1 Tax=Methylobacter sp. TaxID=2051955 RepID=UPI0025891422|nr:quinoprotein relay system zinc metallohydrolase 2 [Methylobacter sp.]MCL7420923.1 quinoprotein relay system zinc metallohydrolase 2 [Methylobacter sp.]